MRLEAGLHQRQEMRLRLAPQVIQSIELLQLPLQALELEIKQQLVDNPTLELKEEQEDPEARAAADAQEKADAKTEAAGDATDRLEALRALEAQWDEGPRRRASGGGDDEDPKQELLQNAPGRRRSLADHLVDQLRYLDLPARTRRVAEYLVFSLDANGYLPVSIDEVVASLPDLFADALPDDAAREVEGGLRLLQSLDPPGVAARDTRECLLLQLKGTDPDLDLKRRLVGDHLDDILENRLPHIARALDLSLERVQEIVAGIQGLNPKPGATFASAAAPVVTPDVIVREVDGEYEVVLEEGSLPPVMVNPHYIELLQSGKLEGAEKEYILRKVEAARRLITAIEQRRHTITRIAREIVRAQRAFLDHGVVELKPMKMQQIADAMGVHVSTVSRAISEKHIQTPRGVFPFKFFFAGGSDVATGGEEAKVNVMDQLRALVAGEDKRSPLSDIDLVKRMREKHGLDLARRTVTKYRKMLKIPSSRRRKQF
jgi:RNA polymerase sigma-54 factor